MNGPAAGPTSRAVGWRNRIVGERGAHPEDAGEDVHDPQHDHVGVHLARDA